MIVRGKKLIGGLLAVFVLIGISLWWAATLATKNRFAIGLYSMQDTPDQRPPRRIGFVFQQTGQSVPDDIGLVARIEKGRAGEKNTRALAYLLSQKGEILLPARMMELQKDLHGKVIEQAAFPSLQSLGAEKTVGLLVIRIPGEPQNIEAALKTIDDANQSAPYDLKERIVKMRVACEKLGWHPEHIMLPIRTNTSKKNL